MNGMIEREKNIVNKKKVLLCADFEIQRSGIKYQISCGGRRFAMI